VVLSSGARHVVSYMKDFLFAPEQARTPVVALSGGERGRLMLARALARPSNLLVLDEPTNDLDLETLDLLQEMLADYPGTVVLVSHDRDFLDRVATSVVFAEGDGVWREYAGGYSDMIAQRGAGVSARAPRGGETPKSKAKAAPAEEKPKKKSRLSFTQQHQLKTLPKEIEKLGREISDMQAELADPDLFAKNPKRFDTLMAKMTQAQEKLSTAEETWLELEILAEEDAG
jgi:ATP-binding cassette subfamily F protein uup